MKLIRYVTEENYRYSMGKDEKGERQDHHLFLFERHEIKKYNRRIKKYRKVILNFSEKKTIVKGEIGIAEEK